MTTFITREELEDLADAVDGDPRFDYSGRGMYGSECVGIVHDESDVKLGIAIAQTVKDESLVDVLARSARTDSMGLSTITYWPSVQVEPEDVTDAKLDAAYDREA